MSEPTLTLILAGTYDQAAHYAHERGLVAKEWRYITDPHSLYGLTGFSVVRIGTFYERKDLPAIEAVIGRAAVVDQWLLKEQPR